MLRRRRQSNGRRLNKGRESSYASIGGSEERARVTPLLTAVSLRHAILRLAMLIAQTPRALKTRTKACRIKVVAMHKMAINVKKSAGEDLTDKPRPQVQEVQQKSGGTRLHGPDSLPAESLLDSQSTRPDPTRYGDWEFKGRCIDF